MKAKQLISKIAGRLGFIPQSELRGIVGKALRQFAAAKQSRLTGDWIGHTLSADAALNSDLKTLRARSRELRDDSDYFKRFLKLVRDNVIGEGITFKMGVRDMDRVIGGKLIVGQPDHYANTTIGREFRDWSKKGNCTVDGRQSLVGVERLICDTVPVDGEILIRKVRGFDNPWGYAIQVLEADHLDHQLSRRLSNGNRIVMGVELNGWGKPVRYWIQTDHPGNSGLALPLESGRWEPVEAQDMIHLYLPIRPEQTRGIPWNHTAMRREWMLKEYEHTESVAARVASGKMGFFKKTLGLGGGSYPDDDPDDDTASPEMTVEPGSFEELPPGLELQTWDPQHPSTAYKDYVKSVLRGIAAGYLVSYHSLANDLEGVNFSSGRLGNLEDRDLWRALQQWIIQDFLENIFSDWLELQLTSGKIPLPLAMFSKFNQPRFRGRRWQFLDPVKETQAAVLAIQNGLASRTRILADQGGVEFEEIATELELEEERLRKSKPEPKGPQQPPQEPNDQEEEDPPSEDPPSEEEEEEVED